MRESIFGEYRFYKKTVKLSKTNSYRKYKKFYGIIKLSEFRPLGVVSFKKESISRFIIISDVSTQEESRAISSNITWGIRRRFEQGKVIVNHTKFMGYDKDESGNLVINEKQAKIVRKIYTDYLNGKGTNRIAHALEKEGIPNWNGKAKWYESSII